MKIRETVRILLFDAEDQLLLMRIDPSAVLDPNHRGGNSSIWVTIGGRIEEGEDVLEAAARELFEETGLSDAILGPVVWYGEQFLDIAGEPTLFKETFVVARAKSGHLTDARWTAEERQAIAEMRWWSIGEVEKASETILPRIIRRQIRAVAQGDYGDGLTTINLSVSEPD